MQHIMAVDVRRRFVFGITIENTSLTSWYAKLVCSKPVNVTKLLNPSSLVFQLSCASLEMPDPGIPVVCIRIKCGHGLEPLPSFCGMLRVTFTTWRWATHSSNHCRIMELTSCSAEQLISDPRRLYSEKGVDTVKQHLLTPVTNAFVRVNGIKDETKAGMMQNKTLVQSDRHIYPLVAFRQDANRP
ncbi:hypothetical protein EI94DRAFT_173 [Lactarius quietus]|nr:hypothetical protein EI94DRAFT_173 [Lactarius quietus]